MKSVKRIVVWMLVLALMAANMTFAGFATEDTPAGTPEGTPISTAEELAAIESGKTYYLKNDILIEGRWTSPTFSGTLDGNGKTVVFSGAYVSGGLFASLNNATVKNLTLTEGLRENRFSAVMVDNNLYFGTLAAQASGTVENVTVKVRLDLGANYKDKVSWCGGLIGGMNGTLTTKKCINVEKIIGLYATGGIIGVLRGTDTTFVAEQCVNYGDLTASHNAAGIVAYQNGVCASTTVSQCANYGTIMTSLDGQNGGGIGGWMKPADSKTLTVENNINYGNVTGRVASNPRISGICGGINLSNGTVNLRGNVNLYALSKLKDQTKNQVASLVGFKGGSGTLNQENNYSVSIVALNAALSAAELTAEAIAKLNEAYGTILTASADGDNYTVTLNWMTAEGLGATPPTVQADVSYSRTDDMTATGTAITDAAGLAALAGSKAAFYLANDITVSGEWTSISGFSGTLDGNGHRILLDGATVTGGLFQTLSGAVIRNLTVTEGENANTFAANGEYFGVLADVGYGWLEQVTIDVAVAIEAEAGSIGGMLGAQSGGALYVDLCRNQKAISSGKAYAGGLVGSAANTVNFPLVISRCVNDGNITATNDAAGMVGAAMGGSLTVQLCVNNGAIRNDAENGGGIVGYAKPTYNIGHIELLQNINNGTVTLGSGKAGGIAGYVHAADGFLTVSGNINYGTVSNNAGIMQDVNYGKGTFIHTQNFGAGDSAGAAAMDDYQKIDSATIATLNAAFPGVYIPASDGGIRLMWTVAETVGAQVRLNDPTGMRFLNTLDRTFLADYGDRIANIRIGTLITPLSYVQEAGGFTKTALDALQKNGTKYLDVVTGGAYQNDGARDVYAGSIANIKTANYTRDFAAILYIEIDGAVYYSADYLVRSVADVARAALADLSDVQTDEYRYAVDGKFSPYHDTERAIMRKFCGQ